MTLLEELKGLTGERVATSCGDPLLEQLLVSVAEDYPGATREKTLDLALARVCQRMAIDSALWFKYSEGSESVDKTKSADQFLAIAKAMWGKWGIADGGGTEGVITIARTDEVEKL